MTPPGGDPLDDPAEAAVASPLRGDPGRSGLFVDFDGTLASIVDDPAAARPLAGVTDLLAGLAAHLMVVAVVSGRPVAFLEAHLPDGLHLSGLYGLETRLADGSVVRADLGPWAEVLADAVDRARAELPGGVEVEAKGGSATLHYRRAPEHEDEVRAWAAGVAASTGLVHRPAKCSVELHPPVATDKGTVLDGLTAGLVAAGFVGDDVGDLAAFDALDRFAGAGGRSWRVAVGGAGADPRLAARADVVLADPAAVRTLLESLLASLVADARS